MTSKDKQELEKQMTILRIRLKGQGNLILNAYQIKNYFCVNMKVFTYTSENGRSNNFLWTQEILIQIVVI